MYYFIPTTAVDSRIDDALLVMVIFNKEKEQYYPIRLLKMMSFNARNYCALNDSNNIAAIGLR